jgi:Beta-propeller repeat
MRSKRIVELVCPLVAIVVTPLPQIHAGNEAWVRHYAAQTSANDRAKKVALDSDSNVFVAGESENGITGTDVVLIKYSSDGVPLWTNRYNGSGNGDDAYSGLAVDNGGNVYLTCNSYNASGRYDFVTIAFSGIGLPLWTNRFSDMAGGDSYAVGLAASAGKIFLTGYSRGGSISDRYVTLAYSSAGATLWTNRYNGPLYDDYPKAIAADDNGNVFVTGNSEGVGSSDDFVTIAYSSAGVPLWTNRFDGPYHDMDSVVGIAVDHQGNVYVTGSTWHLDNTLWSVQYATIAYSNSGIPLWTNISFPGHYDIPAAIVTDNTNVYVTGFSVDFHANIATIAYSTAGLPLWTNLYRGVSSSPNYAESIGVDSAGNVYVTGLSAALGAAVTYDYVTIAYASTGLPLWTNLYNGPANGSDQASSLAVNSHGNIFVTGFSTGFGGSYAFTTLAYSSAGDQLWLARYEGPGHSDNIPVALALGTNGNIHVTGYSVGSNGFYDFATVAWTSAGVPLWTNRYHGIYAANDKAQAIAVGPEGNVYVTGESFGYKYYDYTTIAYSSSGVPLWTNSYDGPGHDYDVPTAIAADSHNGNVYVTGYSDGGPVQFGGTLYDYATIAYSSSGTPLWTNRYVSTPNADDTPYAIAVDGNGNVYVTGDRCITVAYSSAGLPLWTNTYFSTYGTAARAIATDAANNVYVCGYLNNSTGQGSFLTLKYSSAGILQWAQTFNEPGSSSLGQAIALDASGTIFVTGNSSFNGSTFYMTLAYSSAGILRWAKSYASPTVGNSNAKAIAADARGNIFVTGSSFGDLPAYDDAATVAYSPSGAPLWTNRYNGPASGYEAVQGPACISAAPDGAVYVVTASDGDSGTGSADVYTLIKYITPGVQFTALDILSNNACRLTISAPTNFNYRIEASTDLVSWSTLANISNLANGSFQFDDNLASNFPHRYYRAVWLP